MVTLLLLLYFGGVFAVFKVFKVRVTATRIAIAVVLGTFLIGGVVTGWKFAAPISEQMFIKRDVIGMSGSQYSKQQITKIHFQEGVPMKKGDPVFEVDATRNQHEVDRLTAQLAVAKAQVAEAEAGVAVAVASSEGAKANEALQKAEFDRASSVGRQGSGAISQLDLTSAEKTYEASQAEVQQSVETEKAARFALTNAQEAIREIEADLATAKLNLEQCVIRAPADGVVINWQAPVGTMVHPVSTLAVGTFMDTSETFVGAIFPQNLVKNIEAGDTVELALKSLPGEIVAGKVDRVVEYTGEGQIFPEPVIPVAADLKSKGALLVRIVIDDEEVARDLPMGGAGAVAIYTQKGKPFHAISKIMIRIKMWMNYAPF